MDQGFLELNNRNAQLLDCHDASVSQIRINQGPQRSCKHIDI